MLEFEDPKGPEILVRNKDGKDMESQWSKKSKNKNDEGNVKSENDNNSNLTESEINGMRSLKARVKSGEIVITETDKSKRFSILTKEQYRKSG